MIVRRDHIAGALFVIAGIVVWALSGDLPVGSLAFPGAGMMPKLVVAVMIALALATMLSAGSSPPVGELDWGDLGHALRVLAVAIPADALYAWAGFLSTMSLRLFALLFAIERKSLAVALVFSLGVTGAAYVLFGTFLKSPLPVGILGY